MNDLPKVPYRVIEETDSMNQPRVIQLEGQRIDAPRATGFRQHHPQMRNLGNYGRPLSPEEVQNPGPGFYGVQDPNYYGAPNGGTHVNVTNAGQFYRPVKEELTLSFVKTIGNFFAWPFRLVGRFIESLVQAGAGILKMMLLLVIGPMLLFTGMNYYQANKDRPATEMAADLGKEGVHLVGAMLGGIWDGIFGDDEPAEKTDKEAPAK